MLSLSRARALELLHLHSLRDASDLKCQDQELLSHASDQERRNLHSLSHAPTLEFLDLHSLRDASDLECLHQQFLSHASGQKHLNLILSAMHKSWSS